jgi:hypothetical protein
MTLIGQFSGWVMVLFQDSWFSLSFRAHKKTTGYVPVVQTRCNIACYGARGNVLAVLGISYPDMFHQSSSAGALVLQELDITKGEGHIPRLLLK